MEATDLADYTHCPLRAAYREAAIYGISIIIPREGLLFLWNVLPRSSVKETGWMSLPWEGGPCPGCSCWVGFAGQKCNIQGTHPMIWLPQSWPFITCLAPSLQRALGLPSYQCEQQLGQTEHPGVSNKSYLSSLVDSLSHITLAQV